MKKVDAAALKGKIEIDPEWFKEIPMGVGTFRGVIDNYFNAEIEVGAWSSLGNPLYIYGDTEHPCVFYREMVSTYPFGDKGVEGYPKTKGKGKIIVGNDVWIGGYVSLMSGVHIGDGAIVGAHSVVAKAVPPYAIVVGNPARIAKFRFTKRVSDTLLKIKWWSWPEETIKERIEDFKDVGKFIRKYG